jgi:hypothetical protein
MRIESLSEILSHQNFSDSYFIISIMTSFTSLLTFIKSHDVDIIRKSRFSHVIDHRSKNVIIKDICKQENIKSDREKYWLKQRQRLDDAAQRRSRSDRLKKLSVELMNQMLDSQTNLVRDQLYSIQLKHFDIDVSKPTLQRAFDVRKSRVERYKMTKLRMISHKNKTLRIIYEKKHKNYTIENFWQYIHFIDETHFDSNQTFQKRILREESTRYETENMRTLSNMKRIKLHIAVSISWHHK